MPRGYCQYEHCESKDTRLPSIGNERVNGSVNKRDWKGRKYHCICYKKVLEEEAYENSKRQQQMYALARAHNQQREAVARERRLQRAREQQALARLAWANRTPQEIEKYEKQCAEEKKLHDARLLEAQRQAAKAAQRRAEQEELAALRLEQERRAQEREREVAENRRQATILFRAQQMKKDKRKKKGTEQPVANPWGRHLW